MKRSAKREQRAGSMLAPRKLLNAIWPFADQGVVSLGTFLFNVMLARNLPPAEYGVFALLFGAMLALRLINATLLHHPLTISLPVTVGERRAQLLTAAVLLSTVSALLLSIPLVIGLFAFGHPEIALPAVACFIAWQVQESVRRGLLAEFRHHSAIPGDAISYLGQAFVAFLLGYYGLLDLSNALWAMAATSLIAAVVQAFQLKLSLRGNFNLIAIGKEFWSVGSWVLAYGIVSILRIQAFLWALAYLSGSAAAAFFQAALNIGNLANPILFGLTNIIPQTAARARADGIAEAWRAAHFYILLGLPFTFGYYVLATFAPEFILRVFYGPESPYLELAFPVQILLVAFMLAYWADMICSFFHGVNELRLALRINLLGTATGAATVVILALPFVDRFDVLGCSIALAIANAVRLVAAGYALVRMMARERSAKRD